MATTPWSERRIQAALGELISGRTTIAVAHRLSTIQSADVIHVVERGHIVESGTHDELRGQGGSYAALYREQFGNGEIETTCADGTVYVDGRCEHFEGGQDERRRLFLQRHLPTHSPVKPTKGIQ